METIWRLWTTIFNTFGGMFKTLADFTFTINEVTYSGIDILVGSALYVIILLVIAKWIIDFVP